MALGRATKRKYFEKLKVNKQFLLTDSNFLVHVDSVDGYGRDIPPRIRNVTVLTLIFE